MRRIPRQAVTPGRGGIVLCNQISKRSRKLYAFGFMLHYNIFETEKQEKTEWLNRRMDTHGNVFIWNFGKAGKCGL